MTIDELGKIIADLAVSVDKFVAVSQNEFTSIHKEFSAVHSDIEKLAFASQKEFTTIHGEFAAVHEGMRVMARAIEGIDIHLSSYASRWTEDFSKLHDWVQELDSRVKFLEKAKPNQ